MRNGIIAIVECKRDIASCSVCLARNYHSSIAPELGHKVDVLHDVHLGGGSGCFVVCLCTDCLKNLRDAIDNTLSHTDREEN